MRLIALSLIFFVSLHQQALALSCQTAEITEQSVEAYDLIFMGIAKGQISSTGVTYNPFDQKTTYQFEIAKIWKGKVKGKTVSIERRTLWGDTFNYGTSYLITAHKNEKGNYVAGVCSNSKPLYSTTDETKKLEAIFGTERKDTPNE